MPRFTISLHTQKDSFHYDFMLEDNDKLKTWKLNSVDFSKPQIMEQSFDHRKIYLDYEGELTENRGSVKIWDTGTYNIEKWEDNLILAKFTGKKLNTKLLITLKSDKVKPALWEIVATN